MPHWAKSVFSVLLAIALALGIAALQESQKSADENQGAEQHEPHPEAATSTAPWLVILKTLYPGGLEEISEYCNAYSEEEKKKWPQAYYCELKVTDVWIVIFTGVLAFVTFLLVRATIRLWNATVENERPWVGPITVNCDQIIVGRPSRGTIVIKNTGRSPALRMRVAHRGIILNQGQAPPSTPNVWEVPKALFPNAEDFYHPPVDGGPLSQADVAAIIAGTRVLWVIARVEYFDREGNLHHTNICTRWGGVNRPVMVPEGDNDAN